MATHSASDINYSDKQTEILSRASVSRPQDLPTPEQKLLFANAGIETKSEDPVDEYRLKLDTVRMKAAGILPTPRIQLQYDMDFVSRGRFERSTDSSARSMTDSQYVAAMMAVLPFADEESALIINRMLPHYAKSPN
ncbi:hypothetical protein NKJ28_14440 [Mesorhizobium sp. M0145]|uniref:hypothetical protein n=1 Tax=Mesorhizobium sp. M0145 TaxID=2956895 RepID=UPI003338470D